MSIKPYENGISKKLPTETTHLPERKQYMENGNSVFKPTSTFHKLENNLQRSNNYNFNNDKCLRPETSRSFSTNKYLTQDAPSATIFPESMNKDPYLPYKFDNKIYDFNRQYGESKTFDNYKVQSDLLERDKPKTIQAKSELPGNKTYLKLFNLENTYEQKKPNEEFAGGFACDLDIPESQLDLEYDVRPEAKERLISHNANTQSIPTAPINKNSMAEHYPIVLKEDENSVDSIKTYHTSSTLKEMMEKTEKLQQKFQMLEDQLENIKEGESIDKLTDKIKTYNSYYSDINANSSDSDVL